MLLFISKSLLNNDISDANLIRKIRTEVTVSVSSHWKSWVADRAIDFDYSTPPGICNCCSAAVNATAWWRLDLGNTYPIQTIIFIGRNDGKLHEAFFSILCC